ncbi:hypothetical protein AJ80_07458 [Polytolypa hystricis UAMH7299]|uniref:Probable E3 ubiquitin ligase complex SCF subunit sconB n=1 Tax=Polytolypa hystricis (strain UAMH7299) TaxID=1447883 RepID=A0A2B7XQ33_POLH7|nr:hypothetical protein AJ80_07458 [Polytolypa hystricis UAMH7299]
MEQGSSPPNTVPRLVKEQASKYRAGFMPAAASTSFKLDEGYSDETRSQAENEVPVSSEEALALPSWLLAHSEAERAELAYGLLRTLRTSTIVAVLDRLTPILHMDPVLKLPPEITAEIFSYLDPPTLLTASLASKEWRSRILDSRLWRHLYIREGWGLNMEEIQAFERQRSENMFLQSRKSRSRNSDTDVGEPKLKKRVPPTWIGSRRNSDNSIMEDSGPPWNEQNQVVEADATGNPADAEGDHEMRDANDEDHSERPLVHRRSPSSREQQAISHRRDSSMIDCPSKFTPLTHIKAQNKSALAMTLPNGATKLNWTYLYKLRRKLEDNWSKGRFTNFQLPHPSYPSEAHRECVYAIQFTGKWLVSGSRDKSLRVWNLETRRLRGAPLVGHSKSVLCLQFDPSEDEDIIVSGSSDRNIIIWRFSTGEKIHELVHAHHDSVLNLRFDSRFLVTCSKDKLIKVWNRRELIPTDKDYPKVLKGTGVKYPSYIVDTSIMPSAILEAQLAKRQIKSLQPFSLLMTLDGHAAAVNAIQIGENEIVSASGDRLIKVWDIYSGACKKTLIGHQKGIACVQFDNRRIVSGSNDDTVRIYDHASGAEVACLHGHQDLVRTVQAGFGDPPGAEETLRLEAMAVDNRYWEARSRGEISELSPESSYRRRHRHARQARHTGSRNPKDIMVLGAKIPPGGGGSSWGRIVSGSYDETIIIWKKNQEGEWVVGQRLRQEDAALAAAGISLPINNGQPQQRVRVQRPPTIFARQPGPQPQILQQQASQPGSLDQPQQTPHPTPSAPMPSQNVDPSFAGNQQPQPHHPAAGVNPQLLGPTPIPNTPQLAQHGTGPANPQSQHDPPLPPPYPSIGPGDGILPPNNPNGLANLAHLAATATQHPHLPPANNNNNNNNNRPPGAPTQHPTARVFKLQFDARKLICASQDHRIVGWDFACGDPELEEACRFFVGL